MLSKRSKNVYPVNPDVTEFDLNTEVDEYNYDGKQVFRGNVDPEFSTSDMRVHWLYDDNKRVGCVEHIGDTHTCYWFRDNVFSSLLQEDWVAQDRTVWNIMSEEAYEDCMRKGLDTPEKLKPHTSVEIILPSDILKYNQTKKSCIRCGSIALYSGCVQGEKSERNDDVFSSIFVDSDGVIYAPPSDTSVYATLRLRTGAGVTGAGVRTADVSGTDSTGAS
jgi:hypothetical protein